MFVPAGIGYLETTEVKGVKKGDRRKSNKARNRSNKRTQKLAVKRRAHNRKRLRKNPGFGTPAADLKAATKFAQDAAFFSFAAAALNLLSAYGVGASGKLTPVKINCVCEGVCLCHTGLQLAGVPCPSDCPNFGNHFDGCHRCDCATKPQVQ